jgi:hypothetical protein
MSRQGPLRRIEPASIRPEPCRFRPERRAALRSRGAFVSTGCVRRSPNRPMCVAKRRVPGCGTGSHLRRAHCGSREVRPHGEITHRLPIAELRDQIGTSRGTEGDGHDSFTPRFSFNSAERRGWAQSASYYPPRGHPIRSGAGTSPGCRVQCEVSTRIYIW